MVKERRDSKTAAAGSRSWWFAVEQYLMGETESTSFEKKKKNETKRNEAVMLLLTLVLNNVLHDTSRLPSVCHTEEGKKMAFSEVRNCFHNATP